MVPQPLLLRFNFRSNGSFIQRVDMLMISCPSIPIQVQHEKERAAAIGESFHRQPKSVSVSSNVTK